VRHNIGTVDLETGELLEGVPVWVRPKFKPYGKRFFMVSQDALLSIAKDEEMTEVPLKIWVYLQSKLDFENWIAVPQKEIVEELGYHKSAVSRAISLLLRKGMLSRGPKIGNMYPLRLNPNYGFKGRLSHIKQGTKGLHLVGAE
jgi:hypothetical protein